MDKQVSLSGLSDELTQVRTKRKELLSQMERIVLWGEWPYYYKGESGNKTCDLERMLRICLRQNLYDPADEATVAKAIGSREFSDFCGVESGNQAPNGDTLGRFRDLLIRNGRQEKLLCQAVELLQQRGRILKKGPSWTPQLLQRHSLQKIRKSSRPRIRTNNAIERLNREICRRARAVGAFPNGNFALMLVCAM